MCTNKVFSVEPISTSTEYRLGDDDLGNFNLPVVTFYKVPEARLPKCKKIHRDKIFSEGITAASISCMQDYDNVTAFLEDVHINRPMNRKTKSKFSIHYFENELLHFLSKFLAIHGANTC